jgi:hypothetical protein
VKEITQLDGEQSSGMREMERHLHHGKEREIMRLAVLSSVGKERRGGPG